MRSSARPPIADPRTRIRAVLAGAAVGDVLGATWEFSPPSAIPSERRLTVQGGGPFGWPPGAFTDDTDLLLVTASAYGGARAPGAWSEAAFVDGLLAWFRSGPRDVGAQTARGCRHWLSQPHLRHPTRPRRAMAASCARPRMGSRTPMPERRVRRPRRTRA
jgi:hypothetical protein